MKKLLVALVTAAALLASGTAASAGPQKAVKARPASFGILDIG